MGVELQGGGFGGPPGGWGGPPAPPGAPPGGFGAPPGGFGAPPGGFTPPPRQKPITGSPETMALHAMSLDELTGLPKGEKPPASTAAVVALVCGVLLCLGPFTGIAAIVAGFIGRKAARERPREVGGARMALAGIILGIFNLFVATPGFGLTLLMLGTS
jgi:uncharacterized membrane protein YphA (DoxX/SURF4 family)